MERCASKCPHFSRARPTSRQPCRGGRRHGPDRPEALAAKAELAAYGLAEHIQRIVATAPPFTPEQREKLAALLRAP